jgi:AraC-like DNA-binding protein
VPSPGHASSVPAGSELTVPAPIFFPLVDALSQHWGVSARRLLEPMGLTEEDLVEPRRRITHEQHVEILTRARALSGEPAIGYAWGLRMHVASFGYLGFAIMTASTLRHAFGIAEKFFELTLTALPMRLHVEGDAASIVLEERVDYGDVRDVALIARVVGLWRISETICGRELRGSAEVAMPAPAYHSKFEHLGLRCVWGQPTTRLVFDAAFLDYPLVMANRVAHQLACEQCTHELQSMSSERRVEREIRRLLSRPDGGIRSAREVAAAAGATPRTLRRRLAAAGTSLASLLEEERRARSLLLLRTSELPVDVVAERVGYSNTQNFERAFRRWTGMTPASYRRK